MKFLSLACLLLFQVAYSFEGFEYFTEEVSVSFISSRDFKEVISVSAKSPIVAGEIESFIVTFSSEKSVEIDVKEFSSFTTPVLDTIKVVGGREEGDFFVALDFIKNGIPDPKFKDKKCSVRICFKGRKYVYQRVVVDHKEGYSSLYKLPGRCEFVTALPDR